MLAACIVFGISTLAALGYVVFLKRKSNYQEKIIGDLLARILEGEEEDNS